jgi:ABC-2 type transport system ATP-binding protein
MISAKSLTKRFGGTLAVDDLSFDVLPGRVTGFLGPNGAGKTTTMRMMLGLDAPTSGAVTIGGRSYRSMHRPLHEVGAVLDARALHGGRSAYNHLLCLAQSNGIGKRRVTDVLDLVGLSSVERKRAKGFSLGMSQRLGIASALLGDPHVILLDEPVNGLDPEGIRWIRTLLRGLADEGRTVLISSHLMSEMALTADHLVVIGRGRLLADASVADIVGDSGKAYTLVRTPQPALLLDALGAAGATVRPDDSGGLAVTEMTIERIGDVAFRAGVAIHELSSRQPSLEAAFFELTEDSVEFGVAGDAA